MILLPWWVSVILAAVAYAILPGILPRPMVNGGLVGIVTIALLAIAAISALRAWRNRRMLEAQTGLDSLRELPWKRFEDLLGEAYRRQGYKVGESLGGGADGGVDLVLRHGGEVTIVQCKRWKGKPVPVQTVRELYGVLHDRKAAAAKLVATARFTPEAMAFAKKANGSSSSTPTLSLSCCTECKHPGGSLRPPLPPSVSRLSRRAPDAGRRW